MSQDIAVHLNPVPREKANFILFATIDDEERRWEQLWAKQISADCFEICCIPFFVYDLSLGDRVLAGPMEGKQWVIKQVIHSSGHWTFRIWFEHSYDAQTYDEIVNIVSREGCLTEWYSNRLLAIDAPNSKSAKKTANFLDARERAGLLVYETGRMEEV